MRHGVLTRLCLLRSITTIAQTLSQQPALKYVDLGYDELGGALDTACGLAATKNLQQLNLMNNALTGNIPACITQLPQMIEMHLDYNQLTGSIPAFPSSNSPLQKDISPGSKNSVLRNSPGPFCRTVDSVCTYILHQLPRIFHWPMESLALKWFH